MCTQVCHYLRDKHPLKDLFFAIFAISFYILRGFYYPVFVCMAVAIEHPSNLPEHWWFFCLLWGLYVLYIFWMYLIGKMAYRLVVEKDLGGDVRCDGRCVSFFLKIDLPIMFIFYDGQQLFPADRILKMTAKMIESICDAKAGFTTCLVCFLIYLFLDI